MSPALETIPTRHRRELPRRRAAPGSRIRQQIVNFSCTSGFLLVAIKGGSRYISRGATNEKTNTPIELHASTLLGNNASSSPHHLRRDLGLAPSLT